MWELLAVIDPVLVKLGPLEVRWYGIIIVTGILLAIWVAGREAQRLGDNPDLISEAAIWTVPIGILGARAYEVFVLQWGYYSQNPWEIPAVWHGGLAIHGAILAGMVTLIVFFYRRRANVWRWLDFVTPGVILAQAIGRWGNFFNQEAYGQAAPTWVVNALPAFIREQMLINGTYMSPTFLYESIWNLLAFGALLWYRRRNPTRGNVALAYMLLYNLGRFFIEGIRMDSSFITLLGMQLRVAQVASALLALAAGILMVWRARRLTVRYEDP